MAAAELSVKVHRTSVGVLLTFAMAPPLPSVLLSAKAQSANVGLLSTQSTPPPLTVAVLFVKVQWMTVRSE